MCVESSETIASTHRDLCNTAFDAYCDAFAAAGSSSSGDGYERIDEAGHVVPGFGLVVRDWIFDTKESNGDETFYLPHGCVSNWGNETPHKLVGATVEEDRKSENDFAVVAERFAVVVKFFVEKLKKQSLGSENDRKRRKWASVICDALEELFSVAIRLKNVPSAELMQQLANVEETPAAPNEVLLLGSKGNTALKYLSKLIATVAPPKDAYMSFMSVIALSSTFDQRTGLGRQTKAPQGPESLFLASALCILPPLGLCLHRIPSKRAAFLASCFAATLNKVYECNYLCNAERRYLSRLSKNISTAAPKAPSAEYRILAAAALRHSLALLQSLGIECCRDHQDDDFHKVGKHSCLSFIEMVLSKHASVVTEHTSLTPSKEINHPTTVYTALPDLYTDKGQKCGVDAAEDFNSFVSCVYGEDTIPTWTESETIVRDSLCELLQFYALSYGSGLLEHLESYANNPLDEAGGSLESSPLSKALTSYLLFLCLGIGIASSPKTPKTDNDNLRPLSGFPLVTSPLRLINIMLNNSRVLLENGMQQSNDFLKASYTEKGLYLFLGACSLSSLATKQSPAAFETLHGLMSIDLPKYIALLFESLGMCPALSKGKRKLIFEQLGIFSRVYSWHNEFEIYFSVLSLTKYDAVCGAASIILKSRWWEEINLAIDNGDAKRQADNAARLVKFLRLALSSTGKVVDATDMITTALNLLKLIFLSPKTSSCQILMSSLTSNNASVSPICGIEISQRIDISKKLDDISVQLDMELQMETGKAPAAANHSVATCGGFNNYRANISEQRLSIVSFLLAETRSCLSQFSSVSAQAK